MEYTTYTELDKKIDQLVALEKYSQAIELLQNARPKFPDNLWEILQYEGFIWIRLEEYEKCLGIVEECLANSLFVGIDAWDILDPFRHTERFKAIEAEDHRLKAQAQMQAKMEYEVHTPDGYTPEKQYPLFIALHGNGNSVDFFRTHWWKPTAALSKGFVVLYVQSSQVFCTNGFSWTDDYDTTRKEIQAAYDQVLEQYAIDTDNVLIGGFSGGGTASIEITMANTLPTRGFIALCPNLKPDSFSQENVALAVRRGVRGVMMRGELEGDKPEQQEMIAVFQALNFAHQFQIYPGIGHTYPEDFSQQLLDAITFISS
ncbi:MAG: hypothetical protein GY832_06920 [Chloroflexi bacterium]|nr:hypothetical protein [Chloroflexota bacterium]